MAAATVTTANANKAMFFRNVKRKENGRAAEARDPEQGRFYAFNTGAISIATTQIDDVGDVTRLLQFPDNSLLVDIQITATDMDTNGAPALVADVTSETTAAVHTVLISGSTIGQAAGSDDLDRGSGHLLRSVGGTYLSYKVTTASATPAAGTLTAKGIIYIGSPVTVA